VQNDKLTARVEELVSLREQIKKATSEIESVKGSLNEILKELKDSQDEQDASLEDLKQKVSGLNEKIDNSKGLVLQAITRSEQSLSELLNQANGKVDVVLNKADALASNVASLTTICQNIDTLVRSSTNSVTSSINKSKEEIVNAIQDSKAEALKSSNVNRWLIVGGIIILAFLQFILR
jgi:chromosome segregation ATPase